MRSVDHGPSQAGLQCAAPSGEVRWVTGMNSIAAGTEVAGDVHRMRGLSAPSSTSTRPQRLACPASHARIQFRQGAILRGDRRPLRMISPITGSPDTSSLAQATMDGPAVFPSLTNCSRTLRRCAPTGTSNLYPPDSPSIHTGSPYGSTSVPPTTVSARNNWNIACCSPHRKRISLLEARLMPVRIDLRRLAGPIQSRDLLRGEPPAHGAEIVPQLLLAPARR